MAPSSDIHMPQIYRVPKELFTFDSDEFGNTVHILAKTDIRTVHM